MRKHCSLCLCVCAAYLVAGCGEATSGSAGRRPAGAVVDRRVWLLSDIHATYAEDGRDGAEWLKLAVEDMQDNVKDVAYAVCLGDMTNLASNKGLDEYARVRDASPFRRWYEIAGNHDYRAIESGVYSKYVKTPRRCVVVDGNLAWFLVSAESGGSAGVINREDLDWLRRAIERHQGDKNIMVCTHHPVYDTVVSSKEVSRYLHPKDQVAALLAEVRVDLWVCGHAHSRMRTPDCAAVRGRTTFVNVASINHAYATHRATSCVLELTSGSREAVIRTRHHDQHAYLAGQDVHLTFPYPVRLGQPSEPLSDVASPATTRAATALEGVLVPG